MAKTKYKSMWGCTACGATSTKWVGRCPECGEWNTMVEEKVAFGGTQRSPSPVSALQKSVPVAVIDIVSNEEQRIRMPSAELNRVLGGGLVPGSVVLVGGEPGIGKSTLVLQNILAIKSKTILYVSGEEKLFRTDHFKNNISDVLSLLRDTEMLKKVVEPKYDGVSVVFGDELPVKNLENTCFISTKYYRGSAVSGAISVICPQTVQYDDLFLKVAYFAQLLTQTITGTERK